MKSLLALLLAAALSGCSLTHVRGRNGGSLTRISIGTSQQVGHVKASLGESATTLNVGPISVEQVDAAGKALDAAAKIAGPLPGLLP